MPRCVLLALLLASLAGCATPLPTLAPPEGDPGPTLALAGVTFNCAPTAARLETASVGPYERKECVACGEEQPVEQAARAACVDCGAGSFRRAFSRPYVPTFDAAGITERLASTIRERETFASVTTVAASGPPSRQRSALLLEEAQKAEAEWLLEFEVDSLEVAFLEYNGLHVPTVATFIVCAFLIFPAIDPPNWFLPGEDYGIRAKGRWRLLAVETGVVLGKGRFERELCRDSFAPIGLGGIPSRGFFLAGFLRIPGCLDEEHWRDISQNLKRSGDLGLLHALVVETEARRAVVTR